MKAGRELDALIAEKVMGCRVGWMTRGPNSPYPYCDCPSMFGYHNAIDEVHDYLKAYSTDIAAAWEVVEKLQISLNPEIVMPGHRLGGWYARPFRPYDNETYLGERSVMCASTAPLAICLTAVKYLQNKLREVVERDGSAYS